MGTGLLKRNLELCYNLIISKIKKSMNVNIKTKGNINLNDEVRAYVDEKLEALDKFLNFEDDDAVFVEVELQEGEPEKGRNFRADISVNAPGERTHAVGWGENLHAALDESKDELARRLRRDKKKKLSMLKKAGRKVKEILRFGG